jgi:nucleotide sugar dehydrogenase
LCFERAGYTVIGVDVNQEYVTALNAKTFASLEPHVTNWLNASRNFKATCLLDEALEAADIYYIMVDTPTINNAQAYDHKNLTAVLTEINKRKVVNKHIVIGCTVFPGYIRTIGNGLIKDCINTTLSYNPEFVAQGNIMYGLQNPDVVLIGEGSEQAGELLEKLYRTVCLNNPKICRMSPDSAEITKLSVNCFITTKIAFANMVADIADETPGADKYEILAAVGSDKRIGERCLKPGYGFGGPCFPRDNRALGNYAHMMGIEASIPRATDAANKAHAQYMINNFLAQKRDDYIFEGVAYKERSPVPLIEESQKLVVAAGLAQKGKKVIIVDTQEVISAVKERGCPR